MIKNSHLRWLAIRLWYRPVRPTDHVTGTAYIPRIRLPAWPRFIYGLLLLLVVEVTFAILGLAVSGEWFGAMPLPFMAIRLWDIAIGVRKMWRWLIHPSSRVPRSRPRNFRRRRPEPEYPPSGF